MIERAAEHEFRTFDIALGNDPTDSPPDFVHVVVEAGNLSHAFETFAYPRGGRVSRIRDGLLRSGERERAYSRRVPRALYLGQVTWGDRNGSLVLVPPYERVASIHAGHLIFRWRDEGGDHVISLHAWEPFTETVGTLKAIVLSAT